MTIQCKMCGAEFEGAVNAKFCAPCKKQRARDWSRKHYLKEKHGPEVAERYLAAEKQRKEMNVVLEKSQRGGAVLRPIRRTEREGERNYG